MQPTDQRTEIARGQYATEALDNPLIGEALVAWEKEITEAWKTSPLRDVDGRERLRLMLEASRQFQAFLSRTMETGKLAEVQIEQQRTLMDRARGLLR